MEKSTIGQTGATVYELTWTQLRDAIHAMSGGQAQLGNDVGTRMRLLRKRAGLTLSEIGALLGVSRQQVAKYEDGISRIAAEQLMVIARHLDVPLSLFYEDSPSTSPAGDRETGQAIRMQRAFAQVNDAAARDHLIALVEAYAADPWPGPVGSGRRDNV